jgi:DNA-binding transcriptional regulator YhcF (GntR family)
LAIDPNANLRQPDGFFAVAVMTVICQQYLAGHGPTSAREVCQAIQADPRHVQRVLEVLEQALMLEETEDKRFLPARPPARTSAAEVLETWRQFAAPALHGVSASMAVQGIQAAKAALNSSLAEQIEGATSNPNRTLAELVALDPPLSS